MPATPTTIRTDRGRVIARASLGSASHPSLSVQAATAFVSILSMLACAGCASERRAAITPVERYGSVTKSERAILLERRGDDAQLESWWYWIDDELVHHSTPRKGRMPGVRGSARLACPGAAWTETTFDYEFTPTGAVLWRSGTDSEPFALTRIDASVDVSGTLRPIAQRHAPHPTPQRRTLCRVPVVGVGPVVADTLHAAAIPYRIHSADGASAFVILDFDRPRAIEALRSNCSLRDVEVLDDAPPRAPEPTRVGPIEVR